MTNVVTQLPLNCKICLVIFRSGSFSSTNWALVSVCFSPYCCSVICAHLITTSIQLLFFRKCLLKGTQSKEALISESAKMTAATFNLSCLHSSSGSDEEVSDSNICVRK